MNNGNQTKTPAVTPDEAILRTERRARMYKLLSDSFQLPDSGFAGRIQELHEILSELHPGFRELKPQNGSEKTDEKLQVEYSRLFIGPFSLLVPLYGSMYLDHGDQLMTDTSVDVQEWYRSEGLDIAIQDVPDHIRIELEFMYLLAYRELQTYQQPASDTSVQGQVTNRPTDSRLHGLGLHDPDLLDPDLHDPGISDDGAVFDDIRYTYREKQIRFLKQHLSRWIPEFEKKVEKNTRVQLFRDLANITRTFIDADLYQLQHPDGSNFHS